MDGIIEDVKKLKKVCDNVGFYFDSGSFPDCYVVRMVLDTSFLEKYTATQWGIVPKKTGRYPAQI